MVSLLKWSSLLFSFSHLQLEMQLLLLLSPEPPSPSFSFLLQPFSHQSFSSLPPLLYGLHEYL
jgi:hypothetical protein